MLCLVVAGPSEVIIKLSDRNSCTILKKKPSTNMSICITTSYGIHITTHASCLNSPKSAMPNYPVVII